MKKQTRRSISIKGPLYERLRAYCEVRGISASSFVEELIAQNFGDVLQKFDRAPKPRQTVVDVKLPPSLESQEEAVTVVLDRDEERKPPPPRPAADPSLTPQPTDTNPELGIYVPPHMLW